MTSKKILVCDDSRTIQKAVSISLASWPFELIHVLKKEEILEKALNHMPDLILLDNCFNKEKIQDGLDVCLTLKEKETLAHIPIIFLAGASLATEEALRVGASLCLRKPFEVQSFTSELVQWFERQSFGVPESQTPIVIAHEIQSMQSIPSEDELQFSEPVKSFSQEEVTGISREELNEADFIENQEETSFHSSRSTLVANPQQEEPNEPSNQSMTPVLLSSVTEPLPPETQTPPPQKEISQEKELFATWQKYHQQTIEQPSFKISKESNYLAKALDSSRTSFLVSEPASTSLATLWFSRLNPQIHKIKEQEFPVDLMNAFSSQKSQQ